MNIGGPREGLGVAARRRCASTPSQKTTRPREGFGGRSPPKNNNIFIPALCAMRMTV